MVNSREDGRSLRGEGCRERAWGFISVRTNTALCRHAGGADFGGGAAKGGEQSRQLDSSRIQRGPGAPGGRGRQSLALAREQPRSSAGSATWT